MAEYIERETAITTIMSEPPDAHYPHWYADKIKAIQAADVSQVRRWIPVTEKLPENEQDVIICAQRHYYKGGTIPVISTAFHTDGKMNTEESVYNWDSDLDMQYDEENDVYIVPEGWWESVNYGEQFGGVCDFVTHWMPLPQPPEEDV